MWNINHGSSSGFDSLTCYSICLLYTSDAADEEDSVDLGGRRIIKKTNIKKKKRTELDQNKKSKH